MLIAAGERMLVIVAHPDDETFGCGSTIAHATSIGAEVTVVCCTRGEAGELRDDPELRGCDLATVREAELLAAAELLGVAHVEVLGHRDSGFDGPIGPDTLGAPDEALVSIDVSAHLPTREAAIAVHRSQTSPFDGLSPALRRAFLATDHLAETTLR
jgi:LmbE family N-acetylglucosaminyl deacetylase